jgi:molecular chaperone DnaK (HSP70)
VYGSVGNPPRVLPLDDPYLDLPLAISLENRTATVGQQGNALIRRLPLAVCRDYLPTLGHSREWRSGRHRLNPQAAVTLLAERLRGPIGQQPMTVAVPAYLTLPQVTLLTAAFERAKLPIAATISSPLAVATTADGDFGTALVVDADDHALTWTVLSADGEQLRTLATLTQPAAGVSAWLDRLLDAVSDRCVRLCRRDPRDSAAAEQDVYEQVDAALDRLRAGVPIVMRIRTHQWFQELTLAPEELEQFCSPLARQVVDGMRQALSRAHAAVPAMAPPDALWITADAARLPGLVTMLTQHLPESTAVRSLSSETVAAAAHALSSRLPRGHVDTALTLDSRLRISEPSLSKPKTARPY